MKIYDKKNPKQKCLGFFNYIPLRIASTGSNLDAVIAGIIPETKPIIPDNPVPSIILSRLKINSKSKTLVTMRAIPQTINKPIIPPITDKIIASNKN